MDIVKEVDIALSKNQSYAVQAGDGPNGEKAFLCNITMNQSWWIDPKYDFTETVYKREHDGAPYLYDKASKSSVYCIDLQKKLMSGEPSPSPTTTASLPLPAPASSSAGPPAPPAPAVSTQGSAPLQSLQMDSEGALVCSWTHSRLIVVESLSWVLLECSRVVMNQHTSSLQSS